MRIIKTDSVDAVAQLADKSVDLIVTDPPYAFGGGGAEHELTATVAVVLRECTRVLKRDSRLIIMCAASWRSIGYMVESVRGTGFIPKRMGTWSKPKARTAVRTAGWAWQTISCVVLQRGRPKGEPVGYGDHIDAPPITGKRRAQLPPEVAQWAVAPWAVEGGVFLDPFCGSGALPIAAEAAGMDAIGFDASPIEWDGDSTDIRSVLSDVAPQQIEVAV